MNIFFLFLICDYNKKKIMKLYYIKLLDLFISSNLFLFKKNIFTIKIYIKIISISM